MNDHYQDLVKRHKDAGVSVEQDWSGALLAYGDAPDVCPLCNQALVLEERLDSGDWESEGLLHCPNEDHDVVVWLA